MSDPEFSPETRPSRPSKIPSWLMLGFLLGALFVLAWPPRNFPTPPAAGPPATAPEVKHVLALPPQPLTTIEAVFAEWDRYAVWDNDLTEVALWNSATRKFSDCYEVLRSGDAYYFRSIPRLTRPILAQGAGAECPLQFTETEGQRENRLRTNADELWKDIKGGK